MPLTKAQMEFIEYSIDHLLEFPTNKNELSAGINQLKSGITNPPGNHDDNNIYHVLARCLRSPETSFQHMEDYGTDATTQEVRQHLLSLITHALERTIAADNTNTSLSDIGWDITTTDTLFNSKPADLPFKSVNVDYQVSLPWENIQDDDGIYSANLYFNPYYTHVVINITISLPGKLEPVFISEILKRVPLREIDEYRFLERAIPQAKLMSRSCAAATVINELSDLSGPNQTVDYGQLQNHYHLLANKFIAERILNQQMNLNELIDLSSEQLASLAHPFAKRLVHWEICTLKTAANIPIDIFPVMQMYASLIEKRLIPIQDVSQLKPGKLTLLMHPLTVNLIHKNKITFADAAKLSSAIKELFSSALYGDFFLNTDIKWSSFNRLKKKHAAILLHPDIANCIKLGLLTFDQVIFSGKRRRKKLRLEKITSLLASRKLTLHDIDQLTVSKCELLNNHPLLREWLCHGIISLTDLNLRSLTPLYITVFAKRLDAILDNHPYHLYNGKPDTPASLLSEIQLAEWHTVSTAGELRKIAITKIIQHLRLKIETLCLSDTAANAKPLHRKLLQFINTIDRQHEAPLTSLINIIDTAHQYNKQPTCGTLFFRRKHQDAEAFDQLCRQLNTLRCFTEASAAEPTAATRPAAA